MAKAAWAVVTPPQGSGDKEVSVRSDAEHTGRNARNTVLTWKAVNCPDVQRTVMQAGKPEYVDIADTAASEKTGKVVTISGVSNSKRLTFSLGTGDLDIALPAHYTANSVQTANGEAITGDPGGLAVYNFSIAVTVPANTEIDPQTRQVIVTNEGVDRYMEITFRTTRGGDARAVRVVRQAGRREYLRDSAGEILIDSNDVELKALR